MPEFLPCRCSVDAGRFVKIIGDTLQARKQDQRGKGSRFPNLRSHDGDQGKIRISERREIARNIAAKKNKIDEAVTVIKYEPPHLRRDDRGNSPGNKYHGAQNPPAVKRLIEHQGYAQAEQQFQWNGHSDENQRCQQRINRDRVFHEVGIVLPSNRFSSEPRQGQNQLIKAQAKGFEYRKQREDANEDKARQQEQESSAVSAFHGICLSRKRSNKRSISRAAKAARFWISVFGNARTELK